MPNGPVTGVDAAGCIRRLELFPMEGGESVLLKITGSRPLAIELELSQLIAFSLDAGLAHARALSLRADQRARLADLRKRLAAVGAPVGDGYEPDAKVEAAMWTP